MATFDEVMALRQTLTDRYQHFLARAAEAEEAYAGVLQLGIRVPKDVPVHRPSTPSALIDAAAAHIVTDYPVVTVRRPAGRGAGERQAKLAALGRHCFARQRERATLDVWSAVKLDLLLYGAGCVKTVFDEAQWPAPPDGEEGVEEWQESLRYAWPFYTVAVNPTSILVPPDLRWPHAYAIETQKRLAIDVKASYPDWVDYDDELREVEWVEFWTATEYGAWANGQPVFEGRPNPHGIVPYRWDASMAGRALTTDPLAYARGLLDKAMGDLKSEAVARVLMETNMQYMVFPRPLVREDEAKAVEAKWNMAPGGLIPVRQVDGDEKSMKFLEVPSLNPALYTFLPMVQAGIRRATFEAPALSGERIPGVDYGVQQALMIGQARQALRPYVEAMNRLATGTAQLWFRYIDKILGEALVVDDSKRVGSKDIDGWYEAKVQFEAVDPIEDDRRETRGMALHRARLISLETTLRDYLKREDPQGEIAQILAEEVVQQLVQSGMLARSTAETAAIVAQSEGLEGEIRNTAQRVTREAASMTSSVGELSKRVGVPGQGGTVEPRREEQKPQ